MGNNFPIPVRRVVARFERAGVVCVENGPCPENGDTSARWKRATTTDNPGRYFPAGPKASGSRYFDPGARAAMEGGPYAEFVGAALRGGPASQANDPGFSSARRVFMCLPNA